MMTPVEQLRQDDQLVHQLLPMDIVAGGGYEEH
jgi:hypothetical protein